jgi:cytosine/adenosine deaminase-related metal-dependent hydrolase
MTDLVVEGAIVDADGPRRGYVRFRGKRILEVGKIGTASTRGRIPRRSGIVFPAPVNGHTHLGDAVSTGEPPNGPLRELVAPPHGLKFRLLRDTPEPVKRRAMRGELRRLAREGVAVTVDFREEGVPGIRSLRAAARGVATRAFVLGRPLRRPLDPEELRSVLAEADGVGLSSAREEPEAVRRAVASACRSRGKKYALHASEEVREDPAVYLRPRPDLLVHLTEATVPDLEAVRDAGVTVAVCPRSNALFGRRPDLATLERLGIPTMLGTDNAMFHAPSLFRELEFAYVGARLAGGPVRPGFLVRAACVTPWRWLGEPDRAEIRVGSSAEPLVARLPPDDPEYQLATRTTAHLIFRPGSTPSAARSR